MLDGVLVGDAVGGGEAAAAGVVLEVEFPGDAFFIEEVEDGGVGEAVLGGGAVVDDAEGAAGDGGEVVGEGGVGDAEVVA